MSKEKEKSHSKKRRDFQDRYVDMVVETEPKYKLFSRKYDTLIGHVIEEYKSKMNKEFDELTDGKFIMAIEDKYFVSDGVYSVSQWDEFIEFSKYVEEKK